MAPRSRRPLPIADPDELCAALDRLAPRDRAVLEMRHGLGGTRPHNLPEIARLLGISRERVRQLEARAIERLGEGDTAPPTATARLPPPTSRNTLVRRWTLVLLALGPTHVYELRKRLAELGVPPASYRDLYELEANGLVQSAWHDAPAAGPNRRVYTLTSKGTTRLVTDREVLEKTAETLTAFLAKEPR